MESSPDPLSRLSVPPRWRMGLGAAVLLVIVALGAAVLIGVLAPRSEVVALEGEAGAGPGVTSASGGGVLDDGGTAGAAPLLVHVAGAVREPGVYELVQGSRAVDAVAAAGGFTETAARSGLNLARVLADGEQLLVPEQGQETAADAPGGISGDGRVNINTATAAELDTLPRVGPALAAKIIAWRESHGPFAAVDELLSVSGIGAATLEGMREQVTVG